MRDGGGLISLASAVLIVLGITTLGHKGCNNYFNNRVFSNKSYQTVSYTTGILGHVDFTVYSDCSSDIKVYSKKGHRFFDSELQQDLDGDGIVDRIRREGSEIKANRLVGILVRKDDYDSNKSSFDRADRMLDFLKWRYRSDFCD